MILIPFIALGVVSLLMGVLRALFKDKEDWRGIVIKALTMAFLAVFALVTINLTATINALSLFITIGIILAIVKMLELSSKIDSDKTKVVYSGILEILIIVAFAVSTLSLSTFNYLAGVGGLLLGLAVGLLVWAIRREEKIDKALLKLFMYIAIGLFIGFAISGLFTSNHLVSAIVIICASVIKLATALLKEFLPSSRGKQIAIDILETVILVILIVSIYLY